MLLHNPTKLPPIDRFEEISKDATTILHARHFLSLDNLKVSSNPGFAGYAPWHSESFPGQPCACGGGLGWGLPPRVIVWREPPPASHRSMRCDLPRKRERCSESAAGPHAVP